MTSTTPTLTDRYVSAVLSGVPDRRPRRARARDPRADRRHRRREDRRRDARRRRCRTRRADRAGRPGRPGLALHRRPGRLPARAERLPGLARPREPAPRVLVPLIGVLALAASLIDGSTIGTAIVGRHHRGLPGRRADALLVHGGVRDHRARRRTQGAGRAECRRGRRGSTRPRRTGRGRSTTCPPCPSRGASPWASWSATIAVNVFLLAALVWLQLGSTIDIDGQSHPGRQPGAPVVLAAMVHRRDDPRDRLHRRRLPYAADGRTPTPSAMRSSAPRSPSRPSTCSRTTCCSTRRSSTPRWRPGTADIVDPADEGDHRRVGRRDRRVGRDRRVPQGPSIGGGLGGVILPSRSRDQSSAPSR